MNDLTDILAYIMSHKKTVGFVGVGALVIFAIVLIVTTYTPPKTVRMPVKLYPSDATLTIDKKDYKDGATAFVKLGTRTVTVKRDGFTTFSAQLPFSEAAAGQTLVYILQAENDTGKKWVKDHQSEFEDVYTVAEKQTYDANEKYAKKYPIAAMLPYDGGTYKIGSIMGSDPIVITISNPLSTTGYRNIAISQIYKLGFDPGDFQIQFNAYTNPFEGVH